MNEPKPFASLSPSLLARKGAARPAMRPQQSLRHFRDATARQIEDDLGWNDMGDDAAHEQAAEAEPVAETPVAETAEVVSLKPAKAVKPAKVPEVVHQQDAVAERLGATVEKSMPARRSALSDGRRAAFTLRLDAERHLQLRLACTISNRSAQQIVTEALDQFLSAQPDLAALAAQVGKRR